MLKFSKILKKNFSTTKKKCYYKILKLSQNSSRSEIKSQYLKLTKIYHPDINKDEKSKKKFMEIKKSYEILSNKKKRKNYNLSKNYKYEDFFDFDEKFFEFSNENDFLKFQKIFKLKKNFDFKENLKNKLLNEILEEEKKFLDFFKKKNFLFFFFLDFEKINFLNFFRFFGILFFFSFITFLGCSFEPLFITKKIQIENPESFLNEDKNKYKGLVDKISPTSII